MSEQSQVLPRQAMSVAIITYNEAEVIGRCLESVSFADEVVIVDSGSTDATLAIAEAYGAKTHRKAWEGFGRQKQFAVDRCSHDWVLILDADEVIPPFTAKRIVQVLNRPEYQGYSFKRDNYFNNKLIKHGSWGSDTVVRLFHRKTCHVSTAEVHEAVVCNHAGAIPGPIHHFPRRNMASFLEKANTYSSLWAKGNRGKKATMASAILHGGWCFVFNYFFRLGFLDGSEGVVIAFADMVDTFFKYAKLWELTHECSHPERR